MKIAPLIAAVALMGLAVPAMAQDMTNGTKSSGSGVSPTVPTIVAPAVNSSLSDITNVTVFSASTSDGLQLVKDPTLGSIPKVAEAISKAGYSGLPILGYNLDGTSLTVYVQSS